MAHSFDALIVGAGPAGSLAAERLARAGRRVCLFDGRKPQEPKACGGGVTSKALKRYPHLLHAAAQIIDRVEMFAPSGRAANLPLSTPFAIFSRAELDSYLRDRAENAGAVVVRMRARLGSRPSVRSEKWTLCTPDGETYESDFLAAADGVNSPFARLLTGSLPRDEMEVAFGYRTALPSPTLTPTMIAFLEGWQGYAWAFPRVDHVSFGIATGQDSFDHAALDRLLRLMMNGYEEYRRTGDVDAWRSWQKRSAAGGDFTSEQSNDDKTLMRYAARIPCPSMKTWNTRRAAGENWALLGDAAGFADPITGEGIYYALRSGELFAEALLADSIESYEDRWRADFGDELMRAANLRQMFYGHFAGGIFTERMIRLASSHRGTRRILGELISGEQGYTNLRSNLLRALRSI